MLVFSLLTGSDLVRALIVAVAFFIAATAWSWLPLPPARWPTGSAAGDGALPRSTGSVEALCGDLSRDPRAARDRAERALVVDRGAAADAAEQPRPRGRRAARGARRLRRLRDGGAEPRRAAGDRPLAAPLGDDETLLVQSGKPVGVFRTHPGAPRVLIANSLLVPRWATWDEFRRLEALGLTMFGQMTAGSWIYIGTQGILQGTYQTFAAAGEKHFGSPDLARPDDPDRGARRHGRRAAARGDDGGRGDPLRRGRPVTDPSAGSRRATSTRRPSRSTTRSRACGRRLREGRPLSVGLLGNAAEVVPGARAARRALRPRHRPDRGARPAERATSRRGCRSRRRTRCARPIRTSTCRRARSSIAAHVEGMLEFVRHGSYVFDYGNNLRGEAREAGVTDAFSYPGFVPAYIRPLFCRGIGPFRWAALSGDPADIAAIDDALRGLFPDDRAPPALARARSGARRLPGPAGPDLLARATATARRPGSRSTTSSARGRGHGAGRHRPRPPRLRLGRLAVPRDRGDGATAPTRSPTGRS